MSLANTSQPPPNAKYDHNTPAAKNFRKRFKQKFDYIFKPLNIINYNQIPKHFVQISLFYILYHKPDITLKNFIELGVPKGGLSKSNFQSNVSAKLDLIQNLVDLFKKQTSSCRTCRSSNFCSSCWHCFSKCFEISVPHTVLAVENIDIDSYKKKKMSDAFSGFNCNCDTSQNNVFRFCNKCSVNFRPVLANPAKISTFIYGGSGNQKQRAGLDAKNYLTDFIYKLPRCQSKCLSLTNTDPNNNTESAHCGTCQHQILLFLPPPVQFFTGSINDSLTEVKKSLTIDATIKATQEKSKRSNDKLYKEFIENQNKKITDKIRAALNPNQSFSKPKSVSLNTTKAPKRKSLKLSESVDRSEIDKITDLNSKVVSQLKTMAHDYSNKTLRDSAMDVIRNLELSTRQKKSLFDVGSHRLKFKPKYKII